MKLIEQHQEYGLWVGATVILKSDPTWWGIVKHLDLNLPGTTTCNICWLQQGENSFTDSEDPTDWDIQWTNKLTIK